MEPIERKIIENIAKITAIPAGIYFRHGKNILVSFEKRIPNEEECVKIEFALAKFGKPIPNHVRECHFVSWIILR